MNLNRAYHLATNWSLGYVNTLREDESKEYHQLFKELLEREFAAKRLDGSMEAIPVSPCNVCIYYPPSSMNGKPCSCCPACGRC